MRKKSINIFSVVVFIVLTLFTLSLIVLLGWGLLTSLKDYYTDFIINKFGFPKKWMFSNYKTVFEYYEVTVSDKNGSPIQVGMMEQLGNTLIICSLASFLSAFVPCWTGYLVAKYDYKFSKILYNVALIAMALPIIGAYPSELDILNKLGVYNTFASVICQRSSYLGIYFFVYVAMFKSISKDYYDAATLDGASEAGVFFRIMFPMVIGTFFTVILLTFVTNWNDYQYALLYIPSKPTLSYGLYQFWQSPLQILNNEPMAMAGSFILIIPILIVFTIFKNKLMGNVSMGGLKE